MVKSDFMAASSAQKRKGEARANALDFSFGL
jgi:hypothetical protein